MTSCLTWHAEWSLNVDLLDAEHQRLIERLADIGRRFGPQTSAHGGGTALIDALTDFGEAVREHIKREEDLMQEIGYEHLAEHRTEHALLLAEYTDQLRRWRAEGIEIFDEAVQTSIRDWILDHILGADRTFARAYAGLVPPSPSPVPHRASAVRSPLSPPRRGL